MNLTEIPFPVRPEHIRRIPDPTHRASESYFVFCRVQDLPRTIPLTPNPRAQNLKSRIAEWIRKGLDAQDGNFHLKNRGITISATGVEYNNRTGLVKLLIDGTDEDQGIIDGGHTYAIILDRTSDPSWTPVESPADQQYVRLEILTNVGPIASDVARARNTSIQVQEYSLANLEHRFEWIKARLRGKAYANLIAYRENEEYPMDILDIVALLTLFNTDEFSDDRHPIEAYSSKAKCLQLYLKSEQGYRKLENVLPDILELYDYIHLRLKPIYNKVGGMSANEDASGPKAGKFGKLTEITTLKRGTNRLYFLGEEIKYRAPDGWLYPMLGALRYLLREDNNGKLHWKVDDPKKFFDKYGERLVKITVETSRSLGRNPNAVGKSRNHWEQLYDKVRTIFIELLNVDTDRTVRVS